MKLSLIVLMCVGVMGYGLSAEAGHDPWIRLTAARVASPAGAENTEMAAQPKLASAETTLSGGASSGSDLGSARSEAETSVETPESSSAGTFSANYFGLFYGPGLKDASSFQPTDYGQNDTQRPILLKNYIGLGYNITDEIAVTPTAYWTYAAGAGQGVAIRDPFLRVSDSSLYKNEVGTNLYSDLRFHFPVTADSRQADLRAGVQNFNVLSQDIQGTRFGLGFYLSERVNFYGPQGSGNDLELYSAPNVSYQIDPTLSILVLYELQASHLYGQQAFQFNNDGTDVEPGIVWNITPSVMFNPYLNLTTGGAVNLRSTSVGALFSWTMI